MKQKQQRVSQRLVPGDFEVRPAVSLCKAVTSWRGAECKTEVLDTLSCTRCLIHLHMIQGVWICGFLSAISLKGSDFRNVLLPSLYNRVLSP